MKETGRDKILSVFRDNPSEMYLSEVAKRAGISLERAFTYMKEMSEGGYFSEIKRGNMTFYTPNFSCELLVKEFEFIELKRKQTFNQKNIVVGKLIKTLITLIMESVDDLKGFFLFGSVARGEGTGKSDIDILVVCMDKLGEDKIINVASKVGSRYGMEVNTSVVSEKEFIEGLKSKSGFYKNLLRDGLIFHGEKWFHSLGGDLFGRN